MSRRVFKTGHWAGIPWLDIASHGRRGPRQSIRFTRSQLDQIAFTVRHAPEVMVKVSGGGRTAKAVAAHLQYVGRHGKLQIETDDGERLAGREAVETIKEDWMLESERSGHGPEGQYARATGPSKQVHNIVLSMPARTAPDKLLVAAKAFAREEFALKNRYAMVLHTDQKHPHVHLVIKAVGLDGRRLHIRKATLRSWREQFAGQLRAVGVPANATTRRVRGRRSGRMPDGLFRLLKRKPWRAAGTGQTRLAVGGMPSNATARPKFGKGVNQAADAVATWDAIRASLELAGEKALAHEVRAFISTLETPQPGTARQMNRDL